MAKKMIIKVEKRPMDKKKEQPKVVIAKKVKKY